MRVNLEKGSEREELWEEIQRLRRRIEELEKVEREFEEYRRRHPETVGVKHGKAYVLKAAKRQERDGKRTTPTATRPDPEAASDRRPGGQPGHAGHARKRPTRIDHIIPVTLDACPDCGGNDFGDASEWVSRVVEDIPEPATINTQYAQERRWCRGCRKNVMASAPTALPGARFSLRFMLWVLWMHVGLRVPIDGVVQAVRVTFNTTISHGEIADILGRVADAYGPAHEQLLQEVRTRAARYIDEASWPVDGDPAWVWVFVTKWEAVYAMDPRRTHEVPLEILGLDAEGADVHDRHSLYDKLAKITKRPQATCWFHVIADAGELTRTKYHADEAKRVFDTVFKTFHALSAFEGHAAPEEAEAVWDAMMVLLDTRYRNAKVRAFVRNLAKRKDELLRFAYDPEVDGTNNRAERALRSPVVARKIRGGSRAQWAAQAYGRVLSVLKTLELRGNNLVADGVSVMRDGFDPPPGLTSHG